MKNVHSTDGIAEDLIRSIQQMAVLEMHKKTRIEQLYSEMNEGLINVEDDAVLIHQFGNIKYLEEDLNEYADIRRQDMLYLYELYGSKGDKKMWCEVKHLAIASMTAFEVWQASDNDDNLLEMALRKNSLFIKAMSRFLGTEITSCASCFADILKASATVNPSQIELTERGD